MSLQVKVVDTRGPTWTTTSPHLVWAGDVSVRRTGGHVRRGGGGEDRPRVGCPGTTGLSTRNGRGGSRGREVEQDHGREQTEDP